MTTKGVLLAALPHYPSSLPSSQLHLSREAAHKAVWHPMPFVLTPLHAEERRLQMDTHHCTNGIPFFPAIYKSVSPPLTRESALA